MFFSFAMLMFINFNKFIMFVLEIAWEIITDFATELIEGPDKERVRMCLAFHIAKRTEWTAVLTQRSPKTTLCQKCSRYHAKNTVFPYDNNRLKCGKVG